MKKHYIEQIEQIEKVAINASKARYLSKKIGIVNSGKSTKDLKRLVKPFLNKGELLDGREIQKIKENMGSLPNNTYNKIMSVSKSRGNIPEVGADLNNLKNNLSTSNKNLIEKNKAQSKVYTEYANLLERKGLINKFKAKTFKKKNSLLFADTAQEARDEAKRHLMKRYDSKFNTVKGDVLIGSKGNLYGVGNKQSPTVHTHPGHSKYLHIKNSKTDDVLGKQSVRLAEGFTDKSKAYQLASPSQMDKNLFSSIPKSSHNIIQPERALEGVHQANKTSKYFDRRPRKIREEEANKLRPFFSSKS